MSEAGRILIADDEKTFLLAMADLLRREGYYCDCTQDGNSAIQMAEKGNYDILISDIKMPGNEEMYLIKKVSETCRGMPVILVTGYPSLDSALPSVGLPVVAYLTKPINLDELLGHVLAGVKQSRMFKALCESQSRLGNWQKELKKFTNALQTSTANASAVPVDLYISLSFQNIVGALSDLKQLVEGMAMEKVPGEACHLVSCPRLTSLNDAVLKTIEVLELTKGSFKSRLLGDLREMLNDVIHSDGNQSVREAGTPYIASGIDDDDDDTADEQPC
jgi:CheY-like chemotaxis protein